MSDNTMKVLVIGGGFAGLTAIVGLRKKNKNATIVLAEPKQYMEVLWASYRSAFDEKMSQSSLLDLPQFCQQQNVTHLPHYVTKLTTDSATFSNGETMDDFDLAVVAVGAAAPWAGVGRAADVTERKASVEDRKAQLKEEGDKLLKADNVLIVGGGLIGTELAGDVAFYKKEQKLPVNVTVVHSGSHVCNQMSEKAGGLVHKKLEALGVKIILNEKVVANEEEGTYTLESSGEALPKPDAVAMTVGFSPINSFLDASMLDDKGWVKVDEFFRVQGSNGKIFALGDCETSLLNNSGATTMAQQGNIGNNLNVSLAALETDRKADLTAQSLKLRPCTKIDVQACVTVGRKQGVLYTPSFMTQYIIPGMKNSTQFIMKPKQDLKIKSFP